jgi:hypothetical protein
MMARNEILPEVPPPSLCSSERVKIQRSEHRNGDARVDATFHHHTDRAEAIRMCRHRNASTGSAAID